MDKAKETLSEAKDKVVEAKHKMTDNMSPVIDRVNVEKSPIPNDSVLHVWNANKWIPISKLITLTSISCNYWQPGSVAGSAGLIYGYQSMYQRKMGSPMQQAAMVGGLSLAAAYLIARSKTNNQIIEHKLA